MNAFPYTLQNPNTFPHPASDIQIIETHISWVILTGEYAYKIKKPVDFGFLDYRTLQRRKAFCLEELRLNQRLAPDLYIEVVGITGTPENPEINGEGDPFEYAVKMHQFDPARQLDRIELSGEIMDSLAVKLAAFHQSIAHANTDTPWGEPETLYAPIVDNFTHILETGITTENELADIRHWLAGRYEELKPLFFKRKEEGFIRECHGDIHLANMFLLNDEVQIFDGIEFNFQFRWIDVMSELAFILMDLEHRGQKGFATQLLNKYLEITGDYEGLALLRFYQVYRAMVRAKVASMEFMQSEQERSREQYISYINLARRYTQEESPTLMITHGFSGSGKSTQVKKILHYIEAIVIRSDIERKRLFLMDSLDRDPSIYHAEANQMTYKRLTQLSKEMIMCGFTVIVDATFLKYKDREHFARLAKEFDVPFLILDCSTPVAICEERIIKRQKENHDPSDATVEVLHIQMKNTEALTSKEKKRKIDLNKIV